MHLSLNYQEANSLAINSANLLAEERNISVEGALRTKHQCDVFVGLETDVVQEDLIAMFLEYVLELCFWSLDCRGYVVSAWEFVDLCASLGGAVFSRPVQLRGRCAATASGSHGSMPILSQHALIMVQCFVDTRRRQRTTSKNQHRRPATWTRHRSLIRQYVSTSSHESASPDLW